jgi:hypothetical protein
MKMLVNHNQQIGLHTTYHNFQGVQFIFFVQQIEEQIFVAYVWADFLIKNVFRLFRFNFGKPAC